MNSGFKQTLEDARVWLKENTKVFAFKKLEREIIKTEVCVECGSCVSICPENALTGDTSSGKYVPTLTGECTACGLCYAMCPRNVVERTEIIGDYVGFWKAQATPRTEGSQDGGVANVILQYLVESGKANGAVVAWKSDEEPWRPLARLVKNKEDVAGSAGTVYVHAPVLHELLKGYESGDKSLAVVGTACNIEAVTNLENHPAGYFGMDKKSQVFKVGLFCMESFKYPGLVEFLKDAGIEISKVTRMAISGGKFLVTYNGGEKDWPIAELDHIAAKSCEFCRDLTCKGSDISCGNIGSDEGWTTVILRTEKGEKIFKELVKKGLLTAEPLEEKSIRLVERIARSKAMKHYKH